MNKKRSLSRRDLLDRLYDSVPHDYGDDDPLVDDDYYDDEISRHPEAPLNDSIELEKRSRHTRRALKDRSERERDRDEELEYLEFLAAKKNKQRRERPEFYSGAEKPKANKRQWANCRPVFIGCALTCLVTAGLVKGPEIVQFVGGLFNQNQQQNQQQPQPIQPPQRPQLQPMLFQPSQPNPWLTSTPMVSDRSNSMERIPGLTAAKSTITGFADSDSMTAAYYWTLQVSNSGQQNQEARMRIALPAGVTLSRATLWVNGVPQEAAFSTTEQVTAAYTWVRDGREQRRFLSHDPLVVTQESPGHLLIKAAPITPGGQPLQLRLGFTAPLNPSSSQSASMRLPQIQESNFEVTGTQDVHLQSSNSMWSNETEVTSIPDQGGFLLRGNIKEDRLTSLRVNVARNSSDQFATRATHSPKGTFIVASLKPDSTGHMNLSLLKTMTRPSCRIINSEPASVRLSTLWAYGQIEASVRRNDRFTANELARIFRVVSSVSGATVLEQDSDYNMQGLSRDQFATYGSTDGAGRRGGPSGFDRRSISSRLAAASPAPTPRPSAPSAAPSLAMPQASSPMAAPKPSVTSSRSRQLSEIEFVTQKPSEKAARSSYGSADSLDEVVISDSNSDSDSAESSSAAVMQKAPTQPRTGGPDAFDSTAAIPQPHAPAQQIPLLPIALLGGFLLAFSKKGRAIGKSLMAKFKK